MAEHLRWLFRARRRGLSAIHAATATRGTKKLVKISEIVVFVFVFVVFVFVFVVLVKRNTSQNIKEEHDFIISLFSAFSIGDYTRMMPVAKRYSIHAAPLGRAVMYQPGRLCLCLTLKFYPKLYVYCEWTTATISTLTILWKKNIIARVFGVNFDSKMSESRLYSQKMNISNTLRIHYTLYTIHCTLYIVHYTLCIVHCTLL